VIDAVPHFATLAVGFGPHVITKLKLKMPASTMILAAAPGLMSRNESDSRSDDDNSIPGLVHRDHVSINSSDETDADDNAPNLHGYNSESESESSVPGLIDRVVSDSSDDSDTGSVNYALLHPPRHLLQSESSEASETEAETDDSSDSSNNNDAQHF